MSHVTELSQSKKQGPHWAKPCFRFANYAFQVEDLVTLTNRGINYLTSLPNTMEFVISIGPHREQGMGESDLSRAKEVARLAESEITKDFPLLHAHAVIGIWGALEAMIEDVAVSWMDHSPSVLSEPPIAKIRIPFTVFQSMEQSDR
jgi:hypothetical protein